MSFNIDGVVVPFTLNTEWYVIVIDDDNFYIAQTKYKARTGEALLATTNGSGGQDIVLEMAYKVAGDLPADTLTVIQKPSDTVYDIDDTYTIGGKTLTIPGGSTTSCLLYTSPSPRDNRVSRMPSSA